MTVSIDRRSVLAGLVAGAAGLSAPAVHAQKERRLLFWHPYTQPVRAKFLREAADRFQAANPGLTIDIESMPYPAVPERLPVAAQGKALPDLLIHGVDTSIPLYLGGQLHPATDLVADLGGPGAFVPGLLDRVSRFRDQYLLVPQYVHTRLFLHRRDRFAAAGIAPPKTWEEAIAAAAAVSSPPDHWGWIIQMSKRDAGATNLLWQTALSAGGHFFDAKGNVTFASPEVIEAVDFLAEVTRRAGGPGVFDYNINEGFNLVNSGKTSILVDGAAIVAGAAVDAPAVADQLDAVFVPKRRTDESMIVANSFMLPKGKNGNVEDARAFVRFLMADETYVGFLHTIPLFMFPTTVSASGPAFWENPTIRRFDRIARKTLEALAFAKPVGAEYGLNPFAAPVVNAHVAEDLFARIVLEKVPTAKAVEIAAEQIDAVLKPIRRRLG